MSLLEKFLGRTSIRAKKDFVALISTLSDSTMASLCPQVDFEAGVFELNELPRQLTCRECRKTFALPSNAFLVNHGFLGTEMVRLLGEVNFGFRTNAVGSLSGIEKSHQPKLLILTMCGALTTIESMRLGQTSSWGCFECRTLDNPFPAGWPGKESSLGLTKRILRASTGAGDFLGRLQGEGFVVSKKDEVEGMTITRLARDGFIVLMTVLPQLGADRVFQLTAGNKGDHPFKLVEGGERMFRHDDRAR